MTFRPHHFEDCLSRLSDNGFTRMGRSLIVSIRHIREMNVTERTVKFPDNDRPFLPHKEEAGINTEKSRIIRPPKHLLRPNPFKPAIFAFGTGSVYPTFFLKMITPRHFMKKSLLIISLIIVQSCVAFAQNRCLNDSTIREVRPPLAERDTETVFINPDLPPHYLNGGEKGLQNDLYIKILETAPVMQDSINGRAAVSFIVSKDGQIDASSIKVVRNRSVPEDYLKTAIEAIKKLGKFEPGKQLGTPKRVWYTISVSYPVPLDKINTAE